jgi:hypothetical protein
MEALHDLKRLYSEDEASTEGVVSPRKKNATTMSQVFFNIFPEGEVAISSASLRSHLVQEGKSEYFGPGEFDSLFPKDAWKKIVLGVGYDKEQVYNKSPSTSTFHVAGQSVDEATSMFKYSANQTPSSKLVRNWSKAEWEQNLMQWWMYRNLYILSVGGSVGATRK